MTFFRAGRHRQVILAAAGFVSGLSVVMAEPLPSPLTLEQAMALAKAPHPDLDHALARLGLAQAGLAQAESVSGIRANIELTPQVVLPTGRVNDDWVDDSRARFVVGKRLFDFGRSRGLEDSARADIAAREQQLVSTHQARRLAIMTRFLDVLLADLRYMVDNEALAFHYIAFDKARERSKLGQVSDVDLLELENRYQEMFVTRTRSANRQAHARQQLALALNRPDELPADLSPPRFPGNDREAPDFRQMYEKAREANSSVLAARKDVEAANRQVDAERARRYPVLSVEGEAAHYERELPNRDDYRATLNLRVPLWQGGEDRAAVQAAHARLSEAKARLGRAELDLRQTVLDLVQEIEALRIERRAAKVRLAWRDLYLDRSRALYELEVRSDLGDAQTRITEAQWQAARVEFQLAIAWARLEGVVNSPLEPVLPEAAK